MSALFGYPEDPCEDCFDGECTMNCSPKVMRLSKSASYPFMAAAKAAGVPYGELLRVAELVGETVDIGGGYQSNMATVERIPQDLKNWALRANIEERRRRERARGPSVL